MDVVLKRIQSLGIVPVVVLNDAKDAAPLAKVLREGGLPCAEITFRTEAAEESIRIMVQEYPDMIVGAGTVLTTEQADKAVEAGAKFIVSPGLNPKVVQHCQDKGIPIVPGVNNPGQIEQALELGLDTVKFFPAEASGGLNMIKSMSAAYTNMMFMPTGGINIKNLNEYLAFDKIVACGGSWMVKSDLIQNGSFEKIKELTREAVMTMLGFNLKHIGMNCKDAEEAEHAADRFQTLFGFMNKSGNGSVFAGEGIEMMKSPYLGKNGHIAVSVNSVPRAVEYLSRQGILFNMETAKYQDGKLILLYLKEEIGGFAVHLIQQ
ncbi:bifunctional 4-hydroxy-2-oxoglutarate aldolase/2-dehydro-3-deoxy-phosphogluconate aldolase [Muricomes sp. OA1]|uniref:bifunctional 4-hydroxy-2-oxoglutarate aldolase/2-dehydro-3-deoxy-phosphogluconate aldolase n=1 Tax=Lachnospiraceae TaxID=186803 RepID=UPI00129D8EAB|nr:MULTISPECIES: bifunctional 4-hydroxy-2-oxoglutarate aldolase/2-dehydro-3-deoxy-phosphogluconate aldolase [Lachnospiraceae]MCH1975378.1 bifunctional 4-hydroxy-2-oxoglutarate aldolase/2-dehydro-3-deoxy-phosphogluconate aldolase [Muricomes sp. OA1]MRM88907.1 keto-hydroxyglutarate-aldolase/keto-deoxy-phosphogluconate aldolase [Faecalicatena contorta]